MSNLIVDECGGYKQRQKDIFRGILELVVVWQKWEAREIGLHETENAQSPQTRPFGVHKIRNLIGVAIWVEIRSSLLLPELRGYSESRQNRCTTQGSRRRHQGGALRGEGTATTVQQWNTNCVRNKGPEARISINWIGENTKPNNWETSNLVIKYNRKNKILRMKSCKYCWTQRALNLSLLQVRIPYIYNLN